MIPKNAQIIVPPKSKFLALQSTVGYPNKLKSCLFLFHNKQERTGNSDQSNTIVRQQHTTNNNQPLRMQQQAYYFSAMDGDGV
jgi:hypothetical protein